MTPAEYLEWSKTMGCKQQDFEKVSAFEKCIADRKAQTIADAAKSQAIAERQQMIDYISVGVAIFAVIAIIVMRRPIWRAIERIFISSAAKTISKKRDLTAYKDDVARRIREKADAK